MKKLAPIILTTYRRLDHLKLTLDALSANSLANDSEIYITSDGPMLGHEEEVFRVREYLKKVDGFRRVELCFYDANDRSQIWDKRREIGNLYGCYIFLEEDCVTAKSFLQVMNDGLEKYEADNNVFAILGYKPPVDCAGNQTQVLRVATFNSWGFATWNRAELLVRKHLTKKEYNNLLESAEFRGVVSKSYSLLYFRMLKAIVEGELFAFDIMARLEMMKLNMKTIVVPQSLVVNIGMDGSGEHCGESDKFHVDLSEGMQTIINMDDSLESSLIDKRFAFFYGSRWPNVWRFYSKKIRGKLNV